MSTEKKEWLSIVTEQFDTFLKRVDDCIEKEQQQLKACKKNNELEMKLAHEIKLNKELNERLTELSRRGNELDRVCASFETGLTIADSDQNRLDSAKETYELAKDLTGIRFNFSAPPNVVKGYIKSELHKQLCPFELRPAEAEDALWGLLRSLSKE